MLQCFPSIGTDLPIDGGWGYSQADACILTREPDTAGDRSQDDMLGIENLFIEKRIYLELIVSRPAGEKFAGIEWAEVQQALVEQDGKKFDRRSFVVSGFLEAHWEELKQEWESAKGFRSPSFDADVHNKKRLGYQKRFATEYWFDISRFF